MIEVRPLSSLADFTEAVDLQRTIWGFADLELLPVRLFVVASKVGGQIFGAFDQGRMVAFLLAIPGLKSGGGYYLHSHMMGVLSEYRNAGIGRLLKLKQKEEALSRGITLIEWTFDPLEVKNAFFNIERLGAVVRRYVLNQYGTTTSDLHGGLPTDRCVAEWYLAEKIERPAEAARIVVPMAIQDWKKSDPARARQAQAAISDQFQEHFRAGLAVFGFERSETQGTYILGKWHS
ncbi:GNAT family N-acetyltransferase [Bryobacter aggregatus]|uniref:GNAT family N-acetyltransferase n=1 Tax=Bryobacter aggregatus TaxID=360054 RepID=UPI0004E0C9B1|nr:GNAT family N-acetyltransferase [Bryobacter aggregatus]